MIVPKNGNHRGSPKNLSNELREVEQELRKTRNQLKQRVRESTAELAKANERLKTAIADRMKYLTAGPRGRLLIVDDERIQRELISDIMRSEGYEVLTARDGLDALNCLVEPLPNLIISDLNMPRMSGFEFLAVVRQRFPHLPVIAISGEFEGNQVPTGVCADAYFPKGGYTLDQLHTTISELVSAHPRRPRTDSRNSAPV